MRVKELKKVLRGISKPIDRIAGFCDTYDQMFDCCEVRINDNIVEIDTENSIVEPQKCQTVTEFIAQILAMPEEMDDHFVVYMGVDNRNEFCILTRGIWKVKIVQGATGTGISMQGPQPDSVLDQDCYLTKLFVNDERAKSLNDVFYDFLDKLDVTCDFMGSRNTDKGIFIEFVADAVSSASVVALLAGTFNDVVFCRTPYTSYDHEIYRLTNDHEGRYWAKRAAVFVPADNRDSVTDNDNYQYRIQDLVYAKRECDTEQEMEQFIAEHNPDEELGDIAVRIISRYIDDPLDLILKPWPNGNYE